MNTEITLEEMKSMLDELPAFMMKKIVSLLSEYKRDKEDGDDIKFEVCPKCGVVHPRLFKAGKTAG